MRRLQYSLILTFFTEAWADTGTTPEEGKCLSYPASSLQALIRMLIKFDPAERYTAEQAAKLEQGAQSKRVWKFH